MCAFKLKTQGYDTETMEEMQGLVPRFLSKSKSAENLKSTLKARRPEKKWNMQTNLHIGGLIGTQAVGRHQSLHTSDITNSDALSEGLEPWGSGAQQTLHH